ncbi:MAG: hypothetical protein WBG62_03115, partial [Cyclobacteriaceae bacterium]
MKTTYFYAILIGLLCFACSTQEEVIPKKVTTTTEDLTLPTEETFCNILGPASVDPSTSESYTYDSDLNPSAVSWAVTSGDIVILTGQFSSTVSVQFGSNFNGGSINAYGSNENDEVCSETYSITKKRIACTPPTNVLISQTSGQCIGGSFTFTAYPNGSTDSGSYSWSVSHGATIT